MPGSPSNDRTRWQTRLLVALTLAIPVVILGGFEGTLRLLGYGGHEPLFIDSQDVPGHLETNPRVATRFVANSAAPPLTKADATFFEFNKKNRTLRLVVQGGSSAAGFPFGRPGALTNQLQQRLRRTFPTQDVEVIGTAMSAVNSHTLLDFADEILALEPDAVLVYAGHNEFLGILGVGSRFGVSTSWIPVSTFLRIRDLATFQFLSRVRSWVRGLVRTSEEDDSDAGTLMTRVAGAREIPRSSDLYERGLQQFESNLTGLLSRYRDAGVPVFIGTLVSNERDQPPFISALPEPPERERFQRHLTQARTEYEAGEFAASLETTRALLASLDESADAHFLRGRILEATGDTGSARRAYQMAKDRDLLRFRAPERANEIIRSVAQETGATVVETQAALAAESPGGIVGNSTMLEHLHPNPWGYFLMANAFYDALLESRAIGKRVQVESRASAWAAQPISDVDRIAGEIRAEVLRSNWPFVENSGSPVTPVFHPENRIERIALRMEKKELSWTDAMLKLLQIYQKRGEHDRAARIAVNMAEVYAHVPKMSVNAAKALIRAERTDEAQVYLEWAIARAPDEAESRRLLDALRSGAPNRTGRTSDTTANEDPLPEEPRQP
ncbi:tetratricopeptide repeat protein [Myxococcota bacterium]|nr:tetratricopeptide repeat protein [Myxococcota bacterium]